MAKQPAVDHSDRSESSYPYYPLARCLALATALKECGGNRNDVAKKVLAHRLSISVDSAVLSQLLGAAKTYGMIEGNRSYRLSESGKRYFFPTGDQEKRRAELSFFGKPGAFQQLIKRFDGNVLPDAVTLSTQIFAVFGDWIRESPEQWMWSNRRWS